MSSCTTPTLREPRRCGTRLRARRGCGHPVDRLETLNEGQLSRDPLAGGRDHRARRLRRARHRRHDPRGAMPASTTSPTSASASVCRSQRSNSRATSPGSPTRTRPEFDEQCKHKGHRLHARPGDDIDKGGTLRLGAYPCVIQPGTTMARCYGTLEISERHRHRYRGSTTISVTR